MWAIFSKEVNSFFSSIIGFVVISVFLLANGVFLWIVPDTNIFDFGFATLNQLFQISPWIFMFLVPAITMRSFAEERKNRTIEIILTRPIPDMQLIAGKYFANLVLVVFSLIPTLVYYYTVYRLSYPVGNVDFGGTLGSYIGLFFLGAVYTAIGIFASSINDNQIIAFITSLFICFFFYILIDLFRGLFHLAIIDTFLAFLSINTHYESISRGIVDTRDVIYFISFIFIFLLSTKLVIEKRKW
jgi:ABC-2 type transport system permease protein